MGLADLIVATESFTTPVTVQETGGLWGTISGWADSAWTFAKDLGGKVIERQVLGPPSAPITTMPKVPLTQAITPAPTPVEPIRWTMGGETSQPPLAPFPMVGADLQKWLPWIAAGAGALFLLKGKVK